MVEAMVAPLWARLAALVVGSLLWASVLTVAVLAALWQDLDGRR